MASLKKNIRQKQMNSSPEKEAKRLGGRKEIKGKKKPRHWGKKNPCWSCGKRENSSSGGNGEN